VTTTKRLGGDSTGALIGKLEDRVNSRGLGLVSDEEMTADAIAAALAIAGVVFTHDCANTVPGDDKCEHPRHRDDLLRLAEALEPVSAEIRAAGFGGPGNWPARRALLGVFSVPPGTPLTAELLAGESPGGCAAAKAGLTELERRGYVQRTGHGIWVRPAPKPRKGER
jgi:hypothetical protein